MLQSKLDKCVYKCTDHHLMQLADQNDALTPYCSNLGEGPAPKQNKIKVWIRHCRWS